MKKEKKSKKNHSPAEKKKKKRNFVVIIFSPPTLPFECHSAVVRSLLDSQTATCSFFPNSHVLVALLPRVIICRTSNVSPTFSNSLTIYAPSTTYFQN